MNYRNKYDEIDAEIVRIVRSAARKSIGKSGLTPDDLSDIEQELMLAAIDALKHLRKNVKNEKAFVARSVHNRLKSIFRERSRKSKNWHGCCLSLNVTVELDNGDIDEVMNLIDSGHLFRNNSYFIPDPYRDIDLAGNLDAVVRKLPESLQEFCHELKDKSVGELAREKKMSRKLIAWKIRELRKELEKLELAAGACR